MDNFSIYGRILVDFGMEWFIVVLSLLWGRACKTGVFPQYSAWQTLLGNHFWEQEVGGSNPLAPNDVNMV
jgi:hypothetical protein